MWSGVNQIFSDKTTPLPAGDRTFLAHPVKNIVLPGLLCVNLSGKIGSLLLLLRCIFIFETDENHACEGSWRRGHRPVNGNGETKGDETTVGSGLRPTVAHTRREFATVEIKNSE